MNDTDIIAAARTRLARRAAGQDVAPPEPSARLQDFAAAYAIQAAIERIRTGEQGDAAIGYKIGATAQASRTLLGMTEPFLGRLYRASTRESGAALPWQPTQMRVYEAEVTLLLGRDLPASDAPYDAAAIAAATRAVLPAIEIVGTPFSPWNGAGGAELVADNAAHGWWIIGTAVTDFAGLDLLDAPVTLTIDGALRATGKGRNVDEGCFGATAWLANRLARMGRTLRAGDYVTTGTATAPQPVAAGQHVVADFGALGKVEVRIGG